MIVLRVEPGLESVGALTQLKLIALRFPGQHALTVSAGGRRLTFGPAWRYDASPACLAALAEFGELEAPVC